MDEQILVYLKEFPMNQHSEKIAESLLYLCGCNKVWDCPDGRRIFYVNKMPDDVPVAELEWLVYEPFTITIS